MSYIVQFTEYSEICKSVVIRQRSKQCIKVIVVKLRGFIELKKAAENIKTRHVPNSENPKMRVYIVSTARTKLLKIYAITAI